MASLRLRRASTRQSSPLGEMQPLGATRFGIASAWHVVAEADKILPVVGIQLPQNCAEEEEEDKENLIAENAPPGVVAPSVPFFTSLSVCLSVSTTVSDSITSYHIMVWPGRRLESMAYSGE